MYLVTPDCMLAGNRVAAYAQAIADWSRWSLAVAEFVHSAVYITI